MVVALNSVGAGAADKSGLGSGSASLVVPELSSITNPASIVVDSLSVHHGRPALPGERKPIMVLLLIYFLVYISSELLMRGFM